MSTSSYLRDVACVISYSNEDGKKEFGVNIRQKASPSPQAADNTEQNACECEIRKYCGTLRELGDDIYNHLFPKNACEQSDLSIPLKCRESLQRSSPSMSEFCEAWASFRNRDGDLLYTKQMCEQDASIVDMPLDMATFACISKKDDSGQFEINSISSKAYFECIATARSGSNNLEAATLINK